VVPISAVQEAPGKAQVFAIIGGRLELRPVKLGVRDEDEGLVQILAGLEPQVQIVRANLGTLKPGTPVKVAASRN